MARKHNTNRDGNAWSNAEILAVWNKGNIIPGYDFNLWRSDRCGKIMKFTEHGNRDSEYGWEIDHIVAVANGGSDLLSNLQPLHWRNNLDKSDKHFWNCPR